MPLNAWLHLSLPNFLRAENGRPCTMKTAHLYNRDRVRVRVDVQGSGLAFLLSNHSMHGCTWPSQISFELRMVGHAP